ncbi:hypothetical protein A1O1_06514 [Capronia coronata CBS 617.96]|uniref:Uncharacterized protein n=1 Tax=Capronia coronata CBS 617.96 TaxID=1182541 RepID=W9YV34_9EURO|nr:uncharacterized protein A1O1_06514 [Capronia coronata CBS 617.96]EXJ86144.1 hypothetical protein A1O1_06514 [Capronia coronata CBS 617.96]
MAPRRHAQLDVDDLEQEYSSAPMSPGTKKKENLKRIMAEDLGQATADYITTSDYGPRHVPNIRIVPKSDLQGTEESKIATANAAKTNSWRAWGDTDEAKTTSAGIETLAGGASGNTHRYRAQQERLDQERDFGGLFGNSRGDRLSIGAQQFHVNSILSSSSNSNKKSFYAKQDRPWPPAGLIGTPAFPTDTGAGLTATATQAVTPNNIPSNKTSSVSEGSASSGAKTQRAGRVNGPPPKGVSTVAASSQAGRAGSLPSRHPYTDSLSSDPSAFVASATQFFARAAKNQQAQPENTNTLATFAAQASEPDTRVTSEKSYPQDPSIRKVPVSEFAFPGNAALAAPDTSTHTDGIASSTALSGFSPSTGSRETPLVPSSVQDAVTGDLIGLGIRNADVGGRTQAVVTGSSPHNGSIMDSPILDDVNNDVLVAGRGKVIVINGIRYVPESELLALKQTPTTSLATRDDPDANRALEGNNSVSITAKLSPQSRAGQLSTSDPRSSSNVSRSALGANPFNPREPIVNDAGKKQDMAPTSQPKDEAHKYFQFRPNSFDEALVLAMRPDFSAASLQHLRTLVPSDAEVAAPLAPIVKAPSRSPASKSTNTIISRWAPVEASPRPNTSVVMPSSGQFPAAEQSNASALQPKSTNGSTIHASTASGESSGNFTKPAATLQPLVSTAMSTGPLIGDRRAFGHLSKVAAAGVYYEPPPVRPTTRRRTHQPGPGYAMLLADLQRSAASPATQAVAPATGMSSQNQQPIAEDSDESEL